MEDKVRIKLLEDEMLLIKDYIRAQKQINEVLSDEVSSMKSVIIASIIKPELLKEILNNAPGKKT